MAFAMGSAHFDAAPRPGVALAVGVSLALHAAVLALLPAGPAPLPGNSAAPLLRVELARPTPRPATAPVPAPAPVVAKPGPPPEISAPEPPRPAPSSRVETPPRMPEPRTARIPETRPETGAARSTTAPARPRSAASTRTVGHQAPPPPGGIRASEATPVSATAPVPAAATGSAAPAPEPGLAAEVRRIIRLRLAGEFHYPVLARRRGWEGEVVLAFRVDADGRIGNVKVANSSGFGLLDSAARDALLRVATVALADGQRPGTPLDLTLPVIYRLSEG